MSSERVNESWGQGCRSSKVAPKIGANCPKV